MNSNSRRVGRGRLTIPRSLKNPDLRPMLAIGLLWNWVAFADLAVREVRIAPSASKTRVPAATSQGRFLATLVQKTEATIKELGSIP